jgi:macrodomain Ter protein organizer (MatP/YcbG family)
VFPEQYQPPARVTVWDEAGGNCDDMVEWVKREHGKGAIDRAGLALAIWWKGIAAPEPPNLVESVDIVRNWRASHAMPLLTFRMGLTKRARRIHADAIVAQRLKRLTSVLDKLAREPNMKLSQMHDLGGCRAILPDIDRVDRLCDVYRGPQDDLFESEGSLKCYDYIREPKADGYRGIHLVGRYQARLAKNEPWNGHRIEIQLRSQLQHAFATAVETVTTFTKAPLKFGGGPEEWRRFFSLMGSALALREGTALVDGVPHDEKELVRELKEITKTLKVRQRLAGWARALRRLPRKNVKGSFKWLLLVLNTTDSTIKVTGYAERDKADAALEEIENAKREDLDAVLVWVRSVQDLKLAYPNYYADTGEFIEALNQVVRS